jgi:IstB-like ATP binding protein
MSSPWARRCSPASPAFNCSSSTIGRRDLMEVIDDRHQRASTILATQVPIERWYDMIGDPTYADAIPGLRRGRLSTG